MLRAEHEDLAYAAQLGGAGGGGGTRSTGRLVTPNLSQMADAPNHHAAHGQVGGAVAEGCAIAACGS